MSNYSSEVPRVVSAQKPEHALAMEALEYACFDYDQINAATFKRFLAAGRASAWLLHIGKQYAGYVLVLYHKGQKAARIYGIAVHPDFRGKGFANMLMTTAEKEAIARKMQSMRLEVKVDNASARALYEKYGFEVVSRLPAYYDDGQDAWRMRKLLKSKG